MDESRHGCMDGWMKYRYLDDCIETWTDIINGWINGRIDGLKDGWMDGCVLLDGFKPDAATNICSKES